MSPYLTFSPLPLRRYVSVALSIGSPRLGVTQHRALWSSDFPRTAFRFPCYDEATLWATLWEEAARDHLACLSTDLTIAHTRLIVKQAPRWRNPCKIAFLLDLGHRHSSHHHHVGFGDLGCVVQEVDEDMCRLPDGNCRVISLTKCPGCDTM